MVATASNTHEVIITITSDAALLQMVIDLYQQRWVELYISRALLEEICSSHGLSFKYFQSQIQLIVFCLNLAPYQEDYYSYLGLSPEASLEEIKQAFRSQSFACHPDLNPNDPQAEERFKELRKIYEVLSDPISRKNYDQQLNTPLWKDPPPYHEKTPEKRKKAIRFGLSPFMVVTFCLFVLILSAFLIDYQSILTHRSYSDLNNPHSLNQLKNKPQDSTPDLGQEFTRLAQINKTQDQILPDDVKTFQPFMYLIQKTKDMDKYQSENELVQIKGKEDKSISIRKETKNEISTENKGHGTKIENKERHSQVIASIAHTQKRKDKENQPKEIKNEESQEINSPAQTRAQNKKNKQPKDKIFTEKVFQRISPKETRQRQLQTTASMSLNQEKKGQSLPGKNNQESQQQGNEQRKSNSITSTYHGLRKGPSHSPVNDDQESQQKKTEKKVLQLKELSTFNQERKDQSSSVKANQKLQQERVGQQEPRAMAFDDLEQEKNINLTSKSKEKSFEKKQIKIANQNQNHQPKSKSKTRFKEKQNTPLNENNNKLQTDHSSTQVEKGQALNQKILMKEVNSFLQDYTKVYESQNLKKFLSFFTPQSEENGKSIKDLRRKYKNTFQKIQEIDYSIKIKKWIPTKHGIQVQGQFQIRAILQDESKINSTGSIILELQPYMESFRVNNLCYSFND